MKKEMLVNLSLLNRNLTPSLEGLLGSVLGSVELFRSGVWHERHDFLSGGVDDWDPFGCLGVLELSVDEVLDSGHVGGRREMSSASE